MNSSGYIHDRALHFAANFNDIATSTCKEESKILQDYADLIDAVAWWSEKADLSYRKASELLAAYRARKPAQPATGCDGCKWGDSQPIDRREFFIECRRCSRFPVVDRWEAKP